MSKFFVGQRFHLNRVSCKTKNSQFVSDDLDFCEWKLEPILPEGAAPSEFTFQQLMDELKRIKA